MKRLIISCLLILGMCLSFAAPAFASGGLTSSPNSEKIFEPIANMSDAEIIAVGLECCEQSLDTNGITSRINEDGCLEITQILPTAAACDLSDDSGTEVAVTVVSLCDASGNPAPASEITYSDYRSATNGDSTYKVYCTQTTYLTLKQESLLHSLRIRVNRIMIRMTYSGTTSATSIRQKYTGQSDSLGSNYEEYSKTTNSPAANTSYYFYPNSSYYNVTSGVGGKIYTEAVVYYAAKSFKLSSTITLNENSWYDYFA